MPKTETTRPERAPDQACVQLFAQRARLTRRVQALVRQVQEAEAQVLVLRARLAAARAASARGH